MFYVADHWKCLSKTGLKKHADTSPLDGSMKLLIEFLILLKINLYSLSWFEASFSQDMFLWHISCCSYVMRSVTESVHSTLLVNLYCSSWGKVTCGTGYLFKSFLYQGSILTFKIEIWAVNLTRYGLKLIIT